ncbi:hypothetical protein MMC16_003027 [Acarospora aff. strigata]|nr:hypothetical protein [Acarospora aff. strigata]
MDLLFIYLSLISIISLLNRFEANHQAASMFYGPVQRSLRLLLNVFFRGFIEFKLGLAMHRSLFNPKLFAKLNAGMAGRAGTSRWDWEDSYDELQHVGEGGQGSCSLIRRCRDNKLMVLKTITNSHLSLGVPIDIRILRDLLPPHRRIAGLLNSSILPDRTELYLEFCDAGDLQDLIDTYLTRRTLIPEPFLWHVLVQLSEALAFLHDGWSIEDNRPYTRSTPPWNRIIHRDIKPANIFLKFRTHHHCQNAYPDIKLGDFGLAAVTTDPAHTADFYCGTYAWQPPEIPEATAKGDIWALGGIIHALAHEGRPPLADVPLFMASWGWGERQWQLMPEARVPQSINGKYSAALDRWMMRCLRWDPSLRPSGEELVGNMGPEARRRMTRQWIPLRRWAFDGLQDF